MSYMADKDHIAITSRDASTTGRKVSVPERPVAPPNAVTYGESSDTYSRIASDSGIALETHPPGRLHGQFAISYSASARHRLCARWSAASESRRLGHADEAVQDAHLERSDS
jgi:hypothetical protein